ncbi:hypothetical protein VPH35_098680 [Triticum aestivum]
MGVADGNISTMGCGSFLSGFFFDAAAPGAPTQNFLIYWCCPSTSTRRHFCWPSCSTPAGEGEEAGNRRRRMPARRASKRVQWRTIRGRRERSGLGLCCSRLEYMGLEL